MAKKADTNDTLQQLKTQLKQKKLGRAFVFHGEETFLLRYYLEQMRKLALDALTESFNYHRMNNETFTVQSFADSVENLPMMARSTFVQVDDIDLFRFSESDRESIAQILSDVPEFCTVVFTYITVPWKPDKRVKLWQTI